RIPRSILADDVECAYVGVASRVPRQEAIPHARTADSRRVGGLAISDFAAIGIGPLRRESREDAGTRRSVTFAATCARTCDRACSVATRAVSRCDAGMSLCDAGGVALRRGSVALRRGRCRIAA